jgi:hypothetical protein
MLKLYKLSIDNETFAISQHLEKEDQRPQIVCLGFLVLLMTVLL